MPSLICKLLVLAGLALSLSGLSGCSGYTLGPAKPERYSSIDKIAVPNFKNNTLEPRASSLVTNNVVQQFQRDGTYRVTNVESADAVLRGTIANIERRQLRSARTNQLRSRELQIQIFLDYTLEDPRDGMILSEGTATGGTNVFLDPNFQLSERQAIDDASRQLAQRLVSRLSEGW